MYYLESKNLVHRDISYTNILLWELPVSRDSDIKQAKRDEIMRELGLSEIESLRRDLGCREGLLIDFDYASLLDLNKEAGQADASSVNESLGESQCESQSSLQGNGQGSSQGKSKEDFEVVDVEDDSQTVIQPFHKNISGTRTVRYF